jgi:prepilin-type processing-associated H-X9-DG protein
MTRRPGAGMWNARGFSALELTGVICVIAVVAGGLLAWGGRVFGRSRETACVSNLKQIGLALALYADDYGGRLPASRAATADVATVYTKNWQLLLCPQDTGPRDTRYDVKGNPVSYFFVPGLANDDPPSLVLAGDTAPRHRGKWNAVWLDGHTGQLPAEELAPYLTKGESGDEK